MVAKDLIVELLEQPEKFREQGKPYQLLQEFYKGQPTHLLIDLFKADHIDVRRAAIWIASELGDQGNNLVDEAIPLLREDDRYISYHVLDLIMVATTNENYDKFSHVIDALESSDSAIRHRAMWLTANANDRQIIAAIKTTSNKRLKSFSSILKLEIDELIKALKSEEKEARIFAAIGLRMASNRTNNLDFSVLLTGHSDEDVQYLGIP